MTEKNYECNMKMHWNVVVGAKWQIVIPNDVRKMIDINPWDNLVVITKNGKYIWLLKADDMNNLIEHLNHEMKIVQSFQAEPIKDADSE